MPSTSMSRLAVWALTPGELFTSELICVNHPSSFCWHIGVVTCPPPPRPLPFLHKYSLGARAKYNLWTPPLPIPTANPPSRCQMEWSPVPGASAYEVRMSTSGKAWSTIAPAFASTLLRKKGTACSFTRGTCSRSGKGTSFSFCICAWPFVCFFFVSCNVGLRRSAQFCC